MGKSTGSRANGRKPDGREPSSAKNGGPPAAGRRPEATAAVVVGCGLPGLAVASELSRQGIHPIVLNGLRQDTESLHCPVPDAWSLPERADLLRLLRGYAAGHSLDIRRGTSAEEVGLLRGSAAPAQQADGMKWTVRTRDGVLLADAVVLAGCGQPALVKLVRTLGFAAGAELGDALRSVGLYVVGAGEALTVPTRELVRQAKRAGQEVAARNATLAGASVLRYRTA
ncbi:FAD-binding protein [Arthrobacter sp. zg-Y820]|uniref:FAD-binding protein n=1 Tax=unclassified Arthrobacter TaxID=235627 RepID=UPI001E29E0EE|nr:MULTISPECIES: FAD-binding protein [unclassified Arthrobacter]MCC9197509.1 FAD-binding protein [Arthrobacter sp. zg-Y820]MDK1280376.1 FAD-binding protein [Arthrobacter sp. zg.Y820]WIB09659.1 FAD-binding protein [Arthrobacter sp. zg-Y820]